MQLYLNVAINLARDKTIIILTIYSPYTKMRTIGPAARAPYKQKNEPAVHKMQGQHGML